MLRFMCFVGCCSVLLGCSNSNELSLPGPRGQTAEAEIVVYEVVLRAILAEWPRSFSRGTVYVSFDNSTHFGNEPPAEFFVRLADLDMTFKSGSDYAEAKKTEKAASIRLTIGLVWSGETAATARVRLPDYHGKLRVRWKRGRWSAESTGGVIIN